jgi:hypothetical protein
MSHTVSSLLVAALVVLAGCAGGIAGPDATGADPTSDSGAQSTDGGTVQFYVSDEQNAISQFEHLNVTVTSVGFQRVDASGDAAAAGNASANTTDGETTTTDGTTSVGDETTAEESSDETETEQTETEGTETPGDGESDSEGDSGSGEWVERDVDSRTVDLTELQGANATLLGNLSVPAGEYEKVFVHVSDVNGTLKTGEQVNVKLPSRKLQLNQGFAVSSESNVEFVFDITVFEAGNSGKFVLKPVASESGTDVPIEVTGGDGDGAQELRASVVGNVTAGENATVKVTRGGEPVADAEVRVNEEVVATTDADGTATVKVPADAEEFELKATTSEDSAGGEGEAELEVELGDSGGESDGQTNASAGLAVALQGSFAAEENVTVVVTDGDGDAVENATVAVDGTVVGETNADGELTFRVPANVSMDSEVTVTSDGETVTVDAQTVAAAN